MVKKIIFTKDYARLSNTEPFIVPDTLAFDFENPCYDLSHSFITLKNGTVWGVFPFRNGFIVPNEFLFAGRLNATISAYTSGGEKFKEFKLLPIKIIEANGEIFAFDEIDGIKREFIEDINALKTKVNELIEKQNQLAETVQEIKEL